MKSTYKFVVIAVLALVPVIPNALLDYTGGDLQYHVSSWVELRNSWSAGRLIPGWAEHANFLLGDPHLSLYPPVSLILGGLLTLLLGTTVAVSAYIWLAMATCGLTMYLASEKFVLRTDRLTAALLYMLGPYVINTAKARYAAAELLVQAWLPLLLLWFYEAIWQKSRRAVVLLGCMLGLTWITNIPASIVLLYGLFTVTVLCALEQRSFRPLLRMLLAECLAGGLAAFYLLPVWVEQKWIARDKLGFTDTRQYLIFMPHPPGLSPLFLTCWIIAIVEILIIAIGLWRRQETWANDMAARNWTYLAVVSFFFQLSLSLPLWQLLPELRFAQFPFRFLPLLGVSLPLLLLSKSAWRALRKPAYIAVALMSLTSIVVPVIRQYRLKQQGLHMSELLVQWKHDGYIGAPEYVPAGATVKTGSGLAPVSVVDSQSTPSCHADLKQQGYDLRTIETDSQSACQLRLATYFYPYWRATDESGGLMPTSQDAAGLLVVTAPIGKHTIRIDFVASSSVRTVSASVSLVTLLIALSALIYSVRNKAPSGHIAVSSV